MFSLRVNYEITANISFMDRLEVVAFNALPAALYPDATTNVYVAFGQLRILSQQTCVARMTYGAKSVAQLNLPAVSDA
jgi:hypothetical protein